MRPGRRHGFTLLELMLAVLVAATLAGLTLVTASRIRQSAARARTQVQFAQWMAACELFRDEYGHFPDLTSTAGASGRVDPARLFAALTGRGARGETLGAGELAGNRRAVRFLALAPEWLLREASGAILDEVIDAFGNSDFVVLIDADLDGRIVGAELLRPAVRYGNSRDGYLPGPSPSAALLPDDGVEGSVIFYSAGAEGRGAEPVVGGL